MLVQLNDDCIIETTYVTHMNQLHGGAVTAIHYDGSDSCTMVDLPLAEVVRLINDAKLRMTQDNENGWRTEIWTPHLTDKSE